MLRKQSDAQALLCRDMQLEGPQTISNTAPVGQNKTPDPILSPSFVLRSACRATGSPSACQGVF